MVGIPNDAEYARCDRWTAIPAWLALHQDVFDIVLDDGIRLVRLSQKRSAISGHFVDGIRNFVPNDRREIIEAEVPAMLLD